MTSPSNWNVLWDDALRAIAVLSVFHRSSTPLTRQDQDKPYAFLANVPDLTEENKPFLLPPLDTISVKFGGVLVAGPRLLLLAALLRIIDSLDQKAHRAGSPQWVTAHLANLRRECREIEKWLEQVRGRFGIKSAEAMAACLTLDDEVRRGVLKGLCAVHIDCGNPPAVALIEEYGRKLDSRAFKSRQASHLLHKQVVREVSLRPKLDEEGYLEYTIQLNFDEGSTILERQEAEAFIAPEIEKEYKNSEVEKILDENKIQFKMVHVYGEAPLS